MDFAGWVTIENNSGKKYEKARIKLIAGDVNVVPRMEAYSQIAMDAAVMASPTAPAEVTEKTFGDYHMYTIRRKVNLN